jgi:hypothetical protein
MQRKFYLFYPPQQVNLLPLVAALGVFNTKAFEEACIEEDITVTSITEEQALMILRRTGGAGCGCYCEVDWPTYNDEEWREQATRNLKTIAEMVEVLHVEKPIKLMDMEEIILEVA